MAGKLGQQQSMSSARPRSVVDHKNVVSVDIEARTPGTASVQTQGSENAEPSEIFGKQAECTRGTGIAQKAGQFKMSALNMQLFWS